MQDLFEAVKGSKLELPVMLSAFYGLRRSEVLGLKWDAIDFQQNTITIKHTITSCKVDGKLVEVASDTTKTKSSRRTLPLVPQFRDMLRQRWEMQEEYKRVCGKCYNREFLDYVCVDEMGNIIRPNYLTTSFQVLLEKNGMRKIRFHDLRHPYVKHTTKIFSLRLKSFQAQPVPDALQKTRRAFLHLCENTIFLSAKKRPCGLCRCAGASGVWLP